MTFPTRYRAVSLVALVIALCLAAAPLGVWARESAPEHKDGWPFHGSKQTRQGLVRATAQVTGLKPADILKQLRDGASIGGIAGSSARRDAVLVTYDAAVDKHFDQAISSGKLPASLANARRAWYKRDARLMIDQPRLRPAFPGLHELHVVVITATVKATGAPREEVRAKLKECDTIAGIAAAHGKTAADVVDFALTNLDKGLNALVSAGKLTTAQRDLWRAALVSSLNTMVTTPGLHVAGKECAA